MTLYEIAIMGAPSADQLAELELNVAQAIEPFGLHLHHEVGWSVSPTTFNPPQKTAAVVAFFGAVGVSEAGLNDVLQTRIPILPIASADGRVSQEIPPQLQPFNCMFYASDGPKRIAMTLLECLGLLPRQRRVFLSYRRNEARGAALQLFDSLSAQHFDVFLDTHGIPPAEDFQALLWHRLCDSDVLVMLDTPTYFDSRWTSAEYGRALAKGLSVLRIGWPGVAASRRTSTASKVNLDPTEVDAATGRLTDQAIDRISLQLETVRSQSHAVRSLNLFSTLQQAVECIGGTVTGVGPHKAVYVTLADGVTTLVVYPTVGVPTSVTLNDAVDHEPGRSVAVLFEHVGLHPRWLEHLDWLGKNITVARWVKASEAAWDFADWVA